MTENNLLTYGRHYMGEFMLSRPDYHNTVDGRYVVSNSFCDITIMDLLHSTTMKLRLDLSSATIDGLPLTCRRYEIDGVHALDLTTMLVRFYCWSPNGSYLGVAKTNLEALMTVEDSISLDVYSSISHCSLFPQSYPPNLHEGIVLCVSENFIRQKNYLNLRLKANNTLESSFIDVPVEMEAFGCFNGLLYGLTVGLVDIVPGANQPTPIDLFKVSLSNGEHFREQTSNSEIAECLRLTVDQYFEQLMLQIIRPFNSQSNVFGLPKCMSSVGRTLFVHDSCEQEKFFSLNLDTLEWTSTMVVSKSVRKLDTDGKQTLMVFSNSSSLKQSVYRYVFNEPDKLSNLVCLQLKRIFDARPSAHEYILSRLPIKFRPKCPFPQS